MSLSLRGIMKPKMSMGGCPGTSCSGCSDAQCLSAGGPVKGVHEDLGKFGGKPGESPAGHSVRKMKEGTYKEFQTADPKLEHERVLKEMKSLPKPKLYAKGGGVSEDKDSDSSPPDIDPKKAKAFVQGFNSSGIPSASEVWGNVKSGLGLAEGGEVMDSDGDMDGDGDEEDSAMLDSCAGELIDALDRKDKAGILEAIRAIILSTR